MSQKYLTTALVAALIVAVTLLVLGQRGATAQQPVTANGEVVRTISVSGEGTVSASPDQATIQIGVRTQAKTADEALAANNAQMEGLISSLKRNNLTDKDIQTRDFSIWPQYRHSDNGSEPTITGYEVSNSVFITVRDLANFGAILDAAVKNGGNQVSGIQFGFSDPAALLQEARVKAMENARSKASQLAALADVKLGSVVVVSEAGAVPPPMLYREEMAMAADGAVPIASGESSVQLTVQVTYEITD